MRIRNFILVFGAVSLFFYSCSNKKEIEDLEEYTDQVDNNTVALVNSLGFDTAGIKIFGDSILVEGDILLLKSLLEKTQPRQTSVTDITGYNKTDIRVFVPQSLRQDETLIINALKEFSKVRTPGSSSNLSFIPSASVNNADVFINYTTIKDQPGLCAYASWPTISNSKMNVGTDIVINSREWRKLNNSQKKFLIIHEFGHNMGLRHTNWLARGEDSSIGAYWIPGTPQANQSDPLSVFNGGTCGYAWAGFSQHDITAINYLQGN